ncbi:MAG: ATP-binding protein [Prevotella sp.]|nr:ATP-binding protein [Prevotella sp.]MCF0192802.1 ATP-binding protein [Prevotella sp.]
MNRAQIVGRHKEQQILQECIDSNQAELLAVYGRRRVGKTFLIKNYYEGSFDFYCTGIYEGTKKEQLANFATALKEASGSKSKLKLADWFEAFEQLKTYIKSLNKDKIVVFIDEMPWFDTPRSRFLKAFELFWNSWGADQQNLKIIVCGSATTWIMSNLLGDKGGMHNRVTKRLKISPFILAETEELLSKNGIEMDRYQIIQLYMALGGVPYYLQKVKAGYSAAQCIDQLFFEDNAELAIEYNILFRSLFKEGTKYRQVVECLSKNLKGMTREELLNALKWEDTGKVSTILENLCNCDFLRCYSAYGKKERGKMYQLTDMFTLFHLRFVKGYSGGDNNHWSSMANSKSIEAWSGYAFEQICLNHIAQLKLALGINGIQTDISSWSVKGNTQEKGTQIDLVIERGDRVINLCEMKFTEEQFSITKDYAEWLLKRKAIFRENTKTNKTLHTVLVTTWGLNQNTNAGVIQKLVTMEELFK